LRDALTRTKVSRADGHAGQQTTGYKAIEEFVMDDMVQFGPITCPKDPADQYFWRKNIYMALLVCGIQIFAPLLVLLQEWDAADHLNFSDSMSWYQVTCLGNNWRESLTTLMGSGFCLLNISIIRTYVDGGRENAKKDQHLPFDHFWLHLGTVVNLWCLLITILLTPLLYWNEEDAAGIVMDSLSLLFLHMLDDLGSGALSHLAMDDAEFQRMVSYTYALLSQCPVRLQDVVDSTARTADDIWKIRLNASGKLLAVSTTDNTRTDASFTQASAAPGIQACECRIMADPTASGTRTAVNMVNVNARPASPASPITTMSPITTISHLEGLRIIYKVSASGRATSLPRWNLSNLWGVLVWFAFLSQIFVPIAFLIGNNTCDEAKVPEGFEL